MSVVLPAPLAPTSPITWPGSTRSSTSTMPRERPYDVVRARASTAATCSTSSNLDPSAAPVQSLRPPSRGPTRSAAGVS